MLEIEHLVRSSIIIFFFVSLVYGQNHPNSEIDSLLKNGIEQIINQYYAEAEKTFIDLDDGYPQNPLGKIYLAATLIAKSVDYEEKFNENQIDSLLSDAKNQTEKLLDKDDENLWYNYYEALIFGYRAYYSSLNSNVISAFSNGILSLSGFQKCLEIDKGFNEAYIAIGTYKYWKSAETKSFNWLPFINDERELGIKYLEKTLIHDSYNQYLAAYSLVWIYIDNKNFKKAVDLSNEMLSKHKTSRFFKWGLARAYEDISKEKAIEQYYDLLNSIKEIKNRNYYNDIILKHKIAMLLFDLRNYDKSLQLCNEILDFNIKSAEIKLKLENRISRVKKLRNELDGILDREGK